VPFSPIPAEFTNLLTKLQSQPTVRVLDLGCGQGEFSQILKQFDISVWGLDRLPAEAGIEASVRGDALRPPILAASLDCIVAGNLVRHLLAPEEDGNFLVTWLRLLRPGGSLLIFEDEPGLSSSAQRNFSDLQTFLAQLMGPSRGPLLALSEFMKIVNTSTPGQAWTTGLTENQCRPDTGPVLEMLMGENSELNPDTAAGRLRFNIERDGMSYGNFWWAHAQLV